MIDKKIVYIPGWMDRAEYNGFPDGLDIWGSRIDYRKKIDAEVVVAHSLGCHFALLNWNEHKNTKLILVNPVLGKRDLGSWALAWLKFFLTEGRKYTSQKRMALFFHFFLKIGLSLEMMRKDVKLILSFVPKENLVVIRGREDLYFCNSNDCKFFVENGIRVVEIDEMGHVWKKEKIEKFIN
ncbi:MAG: hypothetical protein US70_C0028G0018 [Parcubacteria group bacterium GW2011_GWD2_38_11]|nr:MAG: hypothetical protein US70_C0028G0018 [Parcubacteria group bacterium GW2011_GWD2_38_11]